MVWYQNVIELIDMRSFSNVWYWIVVAVMWSSLSHFIMGVPFDMVTRAQRHGGQAMADLDDIVRVNVNRRLHVVKVSGLWLVGFVTAGLTMLGLLGFLYGIRFGQALFLLMAPASLIGLMGANLAARIAREDLSGEALCRCLARHRFKVQLIGMASIFVTAMWGMWQNMNVSALSG
nr:component of SufBCD complex [Alkalilacustris brevis]